MIFVTNLEQSDVHAEIIADVYRIRWQQEISHKTLKSFNGLQSLNSKHLGKILSFIFASMCSYLIKLIIGHLISKKYGHKAEICLIRVQQYVPCTIALLKGMLKGSRLMVYDELNAIAKCSKDFIKRLAPSKRDKSQGKDLPLLTKKIKETYYRTKGRMPNNCIHISIF